MLQCAWGRISRVAGGGMEVELRHWRRLGTARRHRTDGWRSAVRLLMGARQLLDELPRVGGW